MTASRFRASPSQQECRRTRSHDKRKSTMTTEGSGDPAKDRLSAQHRCGRYAILRKALATLAMTGMLSVAASAPSAGVARAFGPPPPPPVGVGGPPPFVGLGGPPPLAGPGFRPPLPRAGGLPSPSRLGAPPALRDVHRGLPGNVRGLHGDAPGRAYGRAARSGYGHSARHGYARHLRYGYGRYGHGYGYDYGSHVSSSDRCYYTYSETRGRRVLVCDED
jgi:hypothetical protein